MTDGQTDNVEERVAQTQLDNDTIYLFNVYIRIWTLHSWILFTVYRSAVPLSKNTCWFFSCATRLYTPLCPLVGCSVSRFVGCSMVGWSVGRSVGLLDGRLVGWLVGPFISWLVTQLVTLISQRLAMFRFDPLYLSICRFALSAFLVFPGDFS